MSAETLTQQGRTLAVALMVDACTVTRSGGDRIFNQTTGGYTTLAGTTVYSGPCQVQIPAQADASLDAMEGGGATTQQLEVKVPVDATVYRVQDLVTVTAAAHDPTLVGRRYRVTGLHAKSFSTARRLQVEETVDA